jgi:hypothetical protein
MRRLDERRRTTRRLGVRVAGARATEAGGSAIDPAMGDSLRGPNRDRHRDRVKRALSGNYVSR